MELHILELQRRTETMSHCIEIKPLSDFVVIVGRKASGKTVMTLWISKSIKRKLVIDPRWQFKRIGYTVHYPERLSQAFQKFPFVVYQPMKRGKESWDEVFAVCEQFTNYTLIIDEVEMFAKPRWYISEHLANIVNSGRHQGIGIICNSRRPAQTHNDLRSNADWVICFHLHEKRDVAYMGEWLNIEESKLRGLEPFHCWVYDVNHAQVYEQKPCPSM